MTPTRLAEIRAMSVVDSVGRLLSGNDDLLHELDRVRAEVAAMRARADALVLRASVHTDDMSMHARLWFGAVELRAAADRLLP